MSSAQETVIIDGVGAVLGRLASTAAKQALLGKLVIIVNCEHVLITGARRNTIIAEWQQAARRGGFSLKGPNLPKRHPERMVKRTIRGMLSYKQQRGLQAWKRIRCYTGVPDEYVKMQKMTLKRQLTTTAIQLSELARVI